MRAAQTTQATVGVVWAEASSFAAGVAQLLDPAEAIRVSRIRASHDQALFVAAAGLLHLVLGELWDRDPRGAVVDRTCRACNEPHGKPRPLVDGWHCSVTHSGDIVGVAWSRAGAIGLDVEQHHPVALDELRAALTDKEFAALAALPARTAEATLLRTWVRKESVVKLTGEGLTGMRAFSVPVTDDARDGPSRATGSGLDEVRIFDLDPRPHYTAALALVGNPALDDNLNRVISLTDDGQHDAGAEGDPPKVSSTRQRTSDSV